MGDSVCRAICWQPVWNKDREGVGLEHLLLREGAADSVMLALDEAGRPFRLTYQLTWDAAWRLRTARLKVTTDTSSRSLDLDTSGDGYVTAIDAVLVINRLNADASAPAVANQAAPALAAEGELAAEGTLDDLLTLLALDVDQTRRKRN